MAQPQYNDTDFVALNNEVFDITITGFDAGVFTVELDGGPYTGSGATITLIRDALLTSIQAGTHANYTAASQATDAIRITATGPAQFIGGTPTCTEPAFIAPGSGDITKTIVTPHEGIAFGVLHEAINTHVVLSLSLLDPLRTAISWVSLDGAPRVLQINFGNDPISGFEKSQLDSLVAAFTNDEIPNIFAQFFRTAVQDVGFVHLAADFVLASKGPPDNGVKLANIGAALASAKDYIQGFQVQEGTTNKKVTVFDGCATAVSGLITIQSLVNLVFDSAIVGEGGLDAGTLSADKRYAVYVIRRDSDGVAFTLGSLKNEWITGDTPTMPAGFSERRYVGSFRTNSSSDIYQQMTEGDGNKVHVEYGANRAVFPSLVVPSGTATAFTPFDLNEMVPVSAPNVQLTINNKNSPDVYLRSRLESTPLNAQFGTRAVDGDTRGNFQMPVWRSKTSSTRELEYCLSGAGGNVDIAVVGYEDLR